MAARKNRIRHDDETRNKIRASQLINRLHQCVDGEVELDATQVSAAKALLNKVLPDLSQVEAQVEATHETVSSEPLEDSEQEWQTSFGQRPH